MTHRRSLKVPAGVPSGRSCPASGFSLRPAPSDERPHGEEDHAACEEPWSGDNDRIHRLMHDICGMRADPINPITETGVMTEFHAKKPLRGIAKARLPPLRPPPRHPAPARLRDRREPRLPPAARLLARPRLRRHRARPAELGRATAQRIGLQGACGKLKSAPDFLWAREHWRGQSPPGSAS